MQISPARRAAFEILRRVEEEASYSAVLLATQPELSAKDRALCHELVLGVLRRQLWLDRSLEHFARRGIQGLDRPVVLSLRLGLYQLRFLNRVPQSAAVNESVNLVRVARLKSAAGFVNAVLRRATREPDYDPTKNVSDRIERLAVETSHPQWLIARWVSQFGQAQAADMARANNQPAVPAFRFTAKALHQEQKSLQIIADLRSGGAQVFASDIAPGAWRLGMARAVQGHLSVDDREPKAEVRRLHEMGLIYFQDESSQLVAHLLGVRDGERVLDVCAAPGSKATLIAALAPQAMIVGGDLYEHRVRTMKELAGLQGASNIHCLVHDASRNVTLAEESFDRVMVDAPCSGTGTLRHNPEIRWRLRPSDVDQLAARQQMMLHEGARTVRIGGALLYSTCSVEIDENEAVVGHFLSSHPQFVKASFDVSPGLVTESGTVRTWPHRHDVDGFFAAIFRRRE